MNPVSRTASSQLWHGCALPRATPAANLPMVGTRSGRAPVRSATRRPMVKLRCSASDGIRVPARPAQHVHRRAFQTCDAGRAGVYLPSEAGTPDTTIERDDADHAGARPYLRRRGTSIKANKYHICCTRVNAHGRSRKRPSRRATPDRAGARPYQDRSNPFSRSAIRQYSRSRPEF